MIYFSHFYYLGSNQIRVGKMWLVNWEVFWMQKTYIHMLGGKSARAVINFSIVQDLGREMWLTNDGLSNPDLRMNA